MNFFCEQKQLLLISAYKSDFNGKEAENHVCFNVYDMPSLSDRSYVNLSVHYAMRASVRPAVCHFFPSIRSAVHPSFYMRGQTLTVIRAIYPFLLFSLVSSLYVFTLHPLVCTFLGSRHEGDPVL